MLNERKFKIHSSIEADIGINEYSHLSMNQ